MKKITLLFALLISTIGFSQTTLGISTERPVTSTQAITFTSNNQFPATTVNSGVFEGSDALLFSPDGSSGDNSWAMASIKPTTSIDISSYLTYSITVKSTSDGEIRFRLQSSGQQAYLTFTKAGEQYGFKRDGNWHILNIPIADFKTANANLNLTAITDLLVLRSNAVNVSTVNNYDFYIDDFYLSSAALGIDNFETNNVTIYPNPASTELKIKSLNTIYNVSVYSLLGQKVLNMNPKSNFSSIDISSLKSGLYVVEVESNGKSMTSKLIKE